MFELIFITSNNEKLAHARHLCSKYNVKIIKQKNYGIGYSEPRILDRENLLAESVKDAIIRFSRTVSNADNKFFFIEDTSVIIHSLSNENKEVPGVDIKYWMKEHSFPSINNELIRKGNCREVTVRSDIILVIPEKLQEYLNLDKRYLVFNSNSEGYFTEKEFEVKTQPLYPWLNNRTFNKWFIPKGFDKPISMLEIGDADITDFRKEAFDKMLNFLHMKGYIKPKSQSVCSKVDGKQTALFHPWLFIICGPTCAGKTTLARYLIHKYNYYHIEASDFMYLNYYERHGVDSNVKIGDFASDVLIKDPGIVVNRILRHIESIENGPIVITGFRNSKEIEIFENNYFGDLTIESIYISSEIKIRYERSKFRGREDFVLSYEDFLIRNEQQEKMGLVEIKNLLKDSIIINEKSLDDYFLNFKILYSKPLSNFEKVKKDYYQNVWNKKKLENAILRALLNEKNENEYFTTTEISYLINSLEEYKYNPKNKNNISRYFNQNFYPYFNVKIINNKIMYRLSNTGYSRSILLQH